ncbi:MAG: dTMP kinase [Alphaproteobacteria bacterium]|nr:dTMP kinase [Alphaproteobacteria bacterium]
MTPGRFITVEGGEGTGKTTQARRLHEWLGARDIEAVLTREPGGTVEAEEIRRLLVEGPAERWEPLTETLLHVAARRVHLDRAILPALRAGTWVVCDRFADSTMAYQGYGLELGPAVVADIHDLVIGDLAPDLTVVLDMPVAGALSRLVRRGGELDRYEARDRAFHQRVRDGFRAIAAAAPARCHLLDADRGADALADAIARLVDARLVRARATGAAHGG